MRRGSSFLAALALSTLPLSAALPSAADDVKEYDGVLVGGTLGLHIARVVPGRAAYPVDVSPGTTRVVATLTGDAGLGSDFWVYILDPDGELAARSPGNGDGQQARLSWPSIERTGFGTYSVVVECGLCFTLTYHLEVRRSFAATGANLTLADERLYVVPDASTSTDLFLTNTGADAAEFAIEVMGLPAGWGYFFSVPYELPPGETLEGEFGVVAPAGLAAGTRVSFSVLVKDASGSTLDTVAAEAAYTSEIARIRAQSNVVVALVEFGGSGINPYHTEFRGPSGTAEHPAWYVDAYPEDAQALDLTLEAATYSAAIAADADVWASAAGDTLYYIPGTRIIGFICFGACTSLDTGGHGTGTASLAAGTTTGQAPDALIVSVTGDFFKGMRWAARQPWIDVISMSLGAWLGTPTVGISDPVGAGTGNPYVPFSPPWGQRIAYESGKRFFTPSSQGWGAWVNDPARDIMQEYQPSELPDGSVSASGACPYIWAGSFSGSPWTFAVETYWPWTELPWRTSCFPPDVVGQGWDLVAASPRSLTGHNSFGNPSGATPQAAGAYARTIHEGRKALGSTQEGAQPFNLLGLPNVLGEGILGEAPPGATLPPQGPLSDGVLTVREAERVFLHSLEQVSTPESYLRHGSDPRWMRDATAVPPGGEFAFEGYGLLTDTARAGLVAVMRGEVAEPLRPDDDAAYAAHFAARLAFWEAHVEGEIWVF